MTTVTGKKVILKNLQNEYLIPYTESTEEIFVATYGTTTYQELLTAYNSNKIIYCNRSGSLYYLNELTGGVASFTTLVGLSTHVITLNQYDTWGSSDYITLEKISNRVTSISSSSTNTQYPSAKCVYDELSDKVDKAGDTMTGALTVPSNTSGYNESFIITNPNVVKGTNPSSAAYWQIVANDSTNSSTWSDTRLGCIQWYLNSAGKVEAVLSAYENTSGSSTAVNLKVGYDNNGSTYTYAPTPVSGSNDNNIATTSWVRSTCLTTISYDSSTQTLTIS